MIRRTSKIVLEVVGVAVAVTGVLLAVLAWRLSSGPVSLPILSQILEDVAGTQLEGGAVHVGDTILRWSPESRQLRMRVVNVTITGADGNRVATLPQLSFRLSVPALLLGQIAPTSVEIYGVHTTLIRRATGISLGLAAADAESQPQSSSVVMGPMIDALINDKADIPALAWLHRFGIHDATLSLVDEVNGVTFEAPNANLEFYRNDEGVSATLNADLTLADTTGHIALEGTLPKDAPAASVRMKLTGLVPAALARMAPAFRNYGLVDAPMAATGDLDILRDGTVTTARLEVDTGEGRFVIPGLAQAPVDLKKAHADLTLDAASHRVTVNDLTLQAGPHLVSMKGRIDYALGQGISLSTARLDLTAGKTTTEIADIFEGPVTLDSARFVGKIDFNARSIDIETLKLGIAGGSVEASGHIGEGARSPAITAKAAIRNIPVNEVRAVWPLALSHRAREWVSENMADGMLTDGDFTIDVPADMLADNDAQHIPIPDGRLRFAFNVTGTTVHYLHGMPPLTNVAAHGLVADNAFDATLSSATVTLAPDHVITVSKGHFRDGELTSHHSIGEISFTASGATADILTLLDREPLKLMNKFGLDPSTVGGTGTVNATLHLPLVKEVTLDEVDFSGTAHADNVAIPHIQPDLSVTSGALDIDVKRTGLKATGMIGLNGSAPLNLTWTESFEPDVRPSSSYRLSGTLGSADRNAIGLKFDKYLGGPAIIDATLTGNGAALDHAVIHADLTPSLFTINYLGWQKPAGVAITLDTVLDITPDQYRFSKFRLSGQGVDAHGDFVMNHDWDWMQADLPTIRLGPNNNLSLRGRRDDKGTLTLDINGLSADASGILHDLVSGTGDPDEAAKAAARVVTPALVADPARRTLIRAAFGKVAGPNGVTFTDLDAHVTLIDDWVYALDLKALDATQKPIKASITPAAGQTRTFSMASSDAGMVFRMLDLANGVSGGTLTANATFDDAMPGSPMKGNIDVAKFRIVNAPVLAKILTLGSLTGIGDTLSGEGIYFDHLTLPFHVTGHRIHVDEARMAGPAIGLTMKGQIDRVQNVVDLEGTLVPAYTINSVLGKVPLLGPLLIGREGEGIFGVTYAVKGATDNPSVIANPLSAIAPGFLRRLFEFGSSMPPDSTPPDAANPAKPAPQAPAPGDAAPQNTNPAAIPPKN